MTAAVTAVLTAVGFALAGCAAGALARAVVGRIPRGVVVAPPWCEVAVAAGWAAVGGGWAFGTLRVGWLPALLGRSWFGVTAGVVDLLRRRLPNALTVPAIPAALVLLTPLGPSAVLRGAAGAALAAAAHIAVHLAAPRAMGAGDVKLSASLGAVVTAASWSGLALALALAAVLTGLTAAAGLVSGTLRAGSSLPHGPSMLVAAWLVTALTATG